MTSSEDAGYNRPNDSVEVPQGTSRLQVTSVDGAGTNLETGDILTPQMSPFSPSNRSAHPAEDGDGRWISVQKTGPDGNTKGLCKVRVDDGMIVNALGERAHITAEPA